MKMPAQGGHSVGQESEAGAEILNPTTRFKQRRLTSFEQLAHEVEPAPGSEMFATWRYRVRGIHGTLYLVSTEKLTSEVALQHLTQHFGRDSVLMLEGGAQ
ncbi:MAG: hypothetical protein KDI31_15765 [Pseudomonadales bacterium]|nr:hypothetical protein [Pseudomonadales bacterium]